MSFNSDLELLDEINLKGQKGIYSERNGESKIIPMKAWFESESAVFYQTTDGELYLAGPNKLVQNNRDGS